jgi:hypothetical protein
MMKNCSSSVRDPFILVSYLISRERLQYRHKESPSFRNQRPSVQPYLDVGRYEQDTSVYGGVDTRVRWIGGLRLLTASSRRSESSPCSVDKAKFSRSLARALFWVRHVVSNRSGMPTRRRSWPIDRGYEPFYGEAASEKLNSLLDVNIDAVRECSEATVARNTQQAGRRAGPLGVQCRRARSAPADRSS